MSTDRVILFFIRFFPMTYSNDILDRMNMALNFKRRIGHIPGEGGCQQVRPMRDQRTELASRLFHRKGVRRYDYGPTRTCGLEQAGGSKQFFAGLRYQRSLDQLGSLDFKGDQ